mmetsp:Transcript_55399/g.168381  ORF Transcript_55399/g.168381 Transcript_55399/m.168381 type:complete len:676 (-) Transcript_55399:392-2419(-)
MVRLSLPVVAAVGGGLVARSLACTIVAVGKDASASGYPIVSHTDDSGADTTDIRWIRVPHQTWPEGSTRKLFNWADGYPRVVSAELSPEYAPTRGQKESVPIGEIPQVKETYAYWDMDYGVQNEVGLSIGESTCTAKTVGWPATPDKPYGYNRAGIEDLSKIALERCATARCAVDTMGAVAVKEGFYSADSGDPAKPDYSDSAEALAVADTKELWIFNVMTGKNNASAIWAAMRVPAGHVTAVGNSFTIRKMKLDDPDNYRYSPGVTELAEEMGWWSPDDDAPGVFDFFGSYGFTPDVKDAPNPAAGELLKNVLSFYSGRRMWRIFSLLSPAEGAKLDPNKGNLPKTPNPYPSSVPAPAGSVTARMVMNVLRDHYEGTPYDLTAGMAAGPFGNPNRGAAAPPGTLGVWERAISMHRSSWSYVLEAKPGVQSVSWLGYDSPHGTAYLPFFGAAAGGAPENFHSHEGYMSKFSTSVAWWAFNMINQYTDTNFQLINTEVRAKAKAIEDEGEHIVSTCLASAKGLGSHKATEELAKCSNKFAEEKVAEWWEFAWSLFAKFGRYSITYNESATGTGSWKYPGWWVNSVNVGYTLWSVDGPFHGIPDVPQGWEPSWNPFHGPFGGRAQQASSTPAGGPAMTLLAALAASAAVGALTFQLGVRRGRHQSTADAAPYVCMTA